VVEEWSADMRYAGQGYEVAVPFRCPPWRLGAAGLRAAFEAVYRALYGRTQPGAAVEVVTWRLRCRGPRPEPPAVRYVPGAARPPATRLAYAPEGGGLIPFTVLDRRSLAAGDVVRGPAIVEEAASATVVGPGSRLEVDAGLNLLIALPVAAAGARG
jgi:N-methylhydantoinase A/oxoprolinase/acetone carboxylase beta subunit